MMMQYDQRQYKTKEAVEKDGPFFWFCKSERRKKTPTPNTASEMSGIENWWKSYEHILL